MVASIGGWATVIFGFRIVAGWYNDWAFEKEARPMQIEEIRGLKTGLDDANIQREDTKYQILKLVLRSLRPQ